MPDRLDLALGGVLARSSTSLTDTRVAFSAPRYRPPCGERAREEELRSPPAVDLPCPSPATTLRRSPLPTGRAARSLPRRASAIFSHMPSAAEPPDQTVRSQGCPSASSEDPSEDAAILRRFQLEPDPVIEAYKRDVDRSLLRENLRRTPEERWRLLAEASRLAEELRRAGRASR